MRRFSLFRSDLPFDQEDANRYLPWIIAVMAALAAFMLAAGITLGHVFISYSSEFEYRLQIQLPFADGEEKVNADRLLEKLKGIRGVRHAERVSDRDMATLLGPWLGTPEMIDLLPVPAAIDVWMEPEAYRSGQITAESLRKAITPSFPGAVVDDYRQWAEDFNDITTLVKRVSYFMALLIVVAAITVVMLISRASVQLHFPIVTLLHRMGAQDSYISRQFQINAAWLTFKGAMVGTLAAAGLYALLGGIIERMEIPLMPEGVLFFSHVVLFLLLPLLMSVLVASTTYLSVQAMIRRIY